MPLVHRDFFPGYTWCIIYCCYQKDFLGKLAEERKRGRYSMLACPERGRTKPIH